MSRGVEWGSAAADAIARVDSKPTLVDETPTPITAARTRTPRKVPAKPKPSRTTGAANRAGGVGYESLKPKTLRFHERQSDEILALLKRLQANRADRTERLTENTLIRIAVELLLDRQAELEGSNEAELAASLGLDYLN